MLKKKKGQAGNAVQYLTRNQALKKLQLKLSEFRRLCILKGIYPREPKKKVHGQNKTYYHVKDVAFLLHEPLLKKVRELAAYDKKVRRALAKKNKDLASRLTLRRPGYRLDHLVRERYPSFVDALRDLDDPLTLVHLFSVLPADATHGIPTESVHLSRRLALEWQAWVVRASALRKVFVSVKGYYYQAEVQGQAVTWLVPHQLTQVLPTDVDFKVMLTFLELYQTTLQFVLFKLYHSMGLKYPPTIDAKIEDETAGGLQAVLADGDEKNSGAKGPLALALAGGKNKNKAIAAAGGEDEAIKEVNPEATRRLGGLSVKVAELEAEIKAMGDARNTKINKKGGAEQQSEDEDSDVELEIDSGDEDEEEDEEEEEEEDEEEGSDDDDGDDDDEDASDPEDADIPASTLSHGKEQRAPSTTITTTLDMIDMDLVGGAVNVDTDDDYAVCSSLFRGLVFFLGREVPREQLMLVIRSYGGEVGWAGDGSPIEEDSKHITHQVSDRPSLAKVYPDREYVQPQWVFDSANARVLVRPGLYAPGEAPPPHLSPFVVEDEEGYVPEYGREIKQLQEAARVARRRAAGEAEDDAFKGEGGAAGGADGQGDGMTEEEELLAAEKRHALELAKEMGAGSDVHDDQEDVPVQEAPKRKRGGTRNEAEADEDAMKDIMMTRKVKRIYTRAKEDVAAKKARVEELEAKAAALKKKKKGPAAR